MITAMPSQSSTELIEMLAEKANSQGSLTLDDVIENIPDPLENSEMVTWLVS